MYGIMIFLYKSNVHDMAHLYCMFLSCFPSFKIWPLLLEVEDIHLNF